MRRPSQFRWFYGLYGCTNLQNQSRHQSRRGLHRDYQTLFCTIPTYCFSPANNRKRHLAAAQE